MEGGGFGGGTGAAEIYTQYISLRAVIYANCVYMQVGVDICELRIYTGKGPIRRTAYICQERAG
jgi:hypothetical protein